MQYQHTGNSLQDPSQLNSLKNKDQYKMASKIFPNREGRHSDYPHKKNTSMLQQQKLCVFEKDNE